MKQCELICCLSLFCCKVEQICSICSLILKVEKEAHLVRRDLI